MPLKDRDQKMKKLALALTITAAFTGSALAADMAPRAYSKAPAPMAAAPSWTGCYVAGGGGYGMYDADSSEVNANTGAFVVGGGTTGGRGWIGQAQLGCDYNSLALLETGWSAPLAIT